MELNRSESVDSIEDGERFTDLELPERDGDADLTVRAA